jgi:beta propeller repeat protein
MQMIARKILIVAGAAAATLPAAGCGPSLIAPSEFDQTAPAISGSTVAWEDTRNDPIGEGTNVWSYDTGTGTQSQVAGGSGDQVEPAVSDSYFVWTDTGRLKAKNRSTGAVTNVSSGGGTQSDPALCGSVVVWSDSRNNSDVYAKNLATGSQTAVATSAAVEAYPACDGGRVVYMYAPVGQQADIRVYDLASGQRGVVANQPWNEWRPAISGNRVVWQAWPSQPDTANGIQIYGTTLNPDLTTGPGFVVTNGPGHQTAPTISGSRVAWEDARNAKPQVWWRDLATTMTEQAAGVEPGSQLAPAISGRTLVLQGNATGPWLIWLVNL